MEIAFLLFDGITALDAVGPYEVLARLPGTRSRMIARHPGPVRTKGGMLALVADHALSEMMAPDVVVVPGGQGADAAAQDREIVDWVRHVHKGTRWTASVCTGALILGAAGILKGREATTHWRARQALAAYGAIPVSRRIAFQDKVVTAAGVSAGIDMALALAARIAGEETARAIQLAIEYAPDPPFDSGTFEAANPVLLERVRTGLQRS